MLLPSALSCEASRPPMRSSQPYRPISAALFTSPPVSPPPLASSSALFATCRALQQMLSSPSPAPSHLPSPPLTAAAPPTTSPMKLRLRSHKSADKQTNNSATDDLSVRPRTKRIAKRSTAPPRGINKRRRSIDDDANRLTVESDNENEAQAPHTPEQRAVPDMPSTPKRMRLAPEVMPLGLERADFDRLQALEQGESNGARPHRLLPPPIIKSVEASSLDAVDGIHTDAENAHNNDDEEWSSAEDRLLVELVLEKLKLSKSDWQDCARSLGKDRGSVGRRWRSLVGGGEVGLKSSARSRARGRICATWR